MTNEKPKTSFADFDPCDIGEAKNQTRILETTPEKGVPMDQFLQGLKIFGKVKVVKKGD